MNAEAANLETNPEEATQTIGDLVSWYMKARETGEVGRGRKSAEASTMSYYESMAKHLKKHGDGLWDMPLADLTTKRADKWAQAMKTDGTAAVSANKALKFAKAVFTAAVAKGKTDRNPLAAVEQFDYSTPNPNPLDIPSAHRLYCFLLSQCDSPLGTAATMALFAGLRESETCGLTWGDIDLKNGVLRIRQAIGRKGGGTTKETYAKKPKNESSSRRVPISAPLAVFLNRRKATMRNDCARIGVKFNESLYALGDLSGEWLNPHEVGRRWAGVAETLALKGIEGKMATFHDLRKTFATLADDATLHDQKALHALLGHADTSVTQQSYIGKNFETLQTAVEAVGAIIRDYQPENPNIIQLPATGTEG